MHRLSYLVQLAAPTEHDRALRQDGVLDTEDAPAAVTVDAPAQPEKPTIIIAPLPDRPIPRGIAGPGLLAHVLVSKFADHLPLHRQEKIFRREGSHLPRSTLCGFVQGSVVLLSRVVDAMWEDAKANARWLCIDATGVLVLAKDRCRRHHFWVVVAERDHVLFHPGAPGAGGGAREPPRAALAGFTLGRRDVERSPA
jgi:transposase